VASKLWTRWKRFAHRAAEIQSLAILTALYSTVVVPIGAVRRPRHPDGGAPRWTPHAPTGPVSIEDARRQF
jgi:hypothetical protein